MVGRERFEGRAGRYFAFDGGEGAGKSTQIIRLAERLVGLGYTVHQTREPGGTQLYEQIRALVLGSDFELSPMSEFLLFSAGRSSLIAEVRQRVGQGQIVLADRCYISSLAYQVMAKSDQADCVSMGLAEKVTEAVNSFAADQYFIFDVDVEVGIGRRITRGTTDRMERQSTEFHRRVNAFFSQYAAEHDLPVIDANQSPEAVSEAVWLAVEPYLPALPPDGCLEADD